MMIPGKGGAEMAVQGPVDLFIIGGGVNGCGIARDAAGRGLSVCLAEMGDLAQATSSSSTKLFHGGLRYLEYCEFRLVREALSERETLLAAMPHIAWPMRFVLPLHRQMRPRWLIRLGLFLYDHLGGRRILPGTTALDIGRVPEGRPLKPGFSKAYEYSDCWVQDSRLVVLNARDAAAHGAHIMTRTRVIGARPQDGGWLVSIEQNGAVEEVAARALVNAGGPWAGTVLTDTLNRPATERVRLVRGSHIVTRRLYDHDKSYLFQGGDGRIIFAIPYEDDFTLIGTTERDHEGSPAEAVCTPEEAAYLCRFASEYFARPITPDDIVWQFSGVRPLYDDGANSVTAATRDYVLSLDDAAGAPLLNIFGGKITTYRRLAEQALEKLAPAFPRMKAPWTATAPLPGGDFPVAGVDGLIAALLRDYPFLTPYWAKRLVRHYGLEARMILGPAKTAADLGRDFGATLTEAELRWLMTHEFAMVAEDVVWRRTRLGLRLNDEQVAALDAWMRQAREDG